MWKRSVFRRAGQLSGQEGGFGVGHAGDEVHDADAGGIEVVFFSGSTNAHESDGLLFAVADFLAGFQLADGGDEGANLARFRQESRLSKSGCGNVGTGSLTADSGQGWQNRRSMTG